MTDHDPANLTEPLLLESARRVAETHPHRHINFVSGSSTSVGGFVAEVDEWVAQIKADAYAAALAARTPTATGDADLRARVIALADQFDDEPYASHEFYGFVIAHDLRAALAASPAPTRPEDES